MAKGAQFSRRVLARTIAGKLVAEPSRQDYWMRVLAAYLVEQNRSAEAGLVIHDIERELYEQSGKLLVHIRSARPLSDSARSALKSLLADKMHAKQVSLSEKTDPDLLGGLVARTADAELDESVRTKLNQLVAIT